MKRIILCILIGLVACSFSNETSSTDISSLEGSSVNDSIVHILFAGDAMQHSPQFKMAYDSINDTYNYDACFRYLQPYIAQTDLQIINLEVPLAGKPYSGYPQFSAPDEYLRDLHKAGFDIVALANNHVIDQGKKGLQRTISQLDSIPYMGAYCNQHERDSLYPLVDTLGGVSIALLNCTYGTNGLKPQAPNVVNYIDTAQIAADLAKVSATDLQIMYIHWGTEYELTANAVQRDIAKWLVSKGVDIVIGSHPHVVQDAEYIDSIPIIYSLGNFVSNQRWENSNGGIMADVAIDTRTHKVAGISYIPFYVHKGYIGEEKQYFIIPTVDYLDGKLDFVLPEQAENELKQCHQLILQRMQCVPLFTRK